MVLQVFPCQCSYVLIMFHKIMNLTLSLVTGLLEHQKLVSALKDSNPCSIILQCMPLGVVSI